MKANGMIRRVTLPSVVRRRSSMRRTLTRTFVSSNSQKRSRRQQTAFGAGPHLTVTFRRRHGGFPGECSMQPEQLRPLLVGPIAFPVTPFHPDLSLDLTGL